MSLRRKIHEEVPTTDRVQRIPLTKERTARLKGKANRVGCPPGQLVRQGIDWIVDLVGESPGRFLKRARELSPLCREVRPRGEDSSENGSGDGSECRDGSEYSIDEESRPFAATLRPARVAGLKEAALDVATAIGKKGRSLPLSQEGPLLQEGSPGRHGPAQGTEPGAGWAALMELLVERLVQEAARWAAESLRTEDIRAGGPSSRQAGQLFEKPSGEGRGGRRVQMSITKEAKQKISERAQRQFGWQASNLARIATCQLIEQIERRPVEALRYVREERGYYQPRNRGKEQHYSYQFAVGLETRRLLKYAPLVLEHALEGGTPRLQDSPEAGGSSGHSPQPRSHPDRSHLNIDQWKLTQKRVLQAAGRRAIESENVGFQPLGPAGQ